MALIKLNNQSLTAVTSAGLPSGTVLQVPATTSSVTYALQVQSGNGSYYMHLNRQDSDSTAWAQSMITVTEIAG
jgi:hypothetical protein